MDVGVGVSLEVVLPNWLIVRCLSLFVSFFVSQKTDAWVILFVVSEQWLWSCRTMKG